MAFSFREEYPVLGSSAKVDMTGSASGSGPAQLTLLPKIQAFEFVQINNLSASSASQTAFVAPAATFGTYQLVDVTVTFGTASSSGTLQVEKATGTQAIAGGTNLLQATLSLAGTANTPVEATGSSAPLTNTNTLTMAAGDRLNLIFGGTLTSLANCSVVITLARV